VFVAEWDLNVIVKWPVIHEGDEGAAPSSPSSVGNSKRSVPGSQPKVKKYQLSCLLTRPWDRKSQPHLSSTQRCVLNQQRCDSQAQRFDLDKQRFDTETDGSDL
jgi:hypothetical protein